MSLLVKKVIDGGTFIPDNLSVGFTTHIPGLTYIIPYRSKEFEEKLLLLLKEEGQLTSRNIKSILVIG